MNRHRAPSVYVFLLGSRASLAKKTSCTRKRRRPNGHTFVCQMICFYKEPSSYLKKISASRMEPQGFKRRALDKYTTCYPWNEEREEEELRKAYDVITGESILDQLTTWSDDVLKTIRPKVLRCWLKEQPGGRPLVQTA